MRGHTSIRDMRLSGFKPAFVWLQDSGLAPTDQAITIDKTENPEALDLRVLVGVTVLAESEDKKRLEQMVRACQQAKALRVIASLHERIDCYRFDVKEITDTEGVLTWPK